MTPTTFKHLLCVIPFVFAFALVGCGDDASNTLGYNENELGDTTPPGAPTNLAINESGGALTVSWDDNPEPDLAGYTLQRSLDDGDSWVTVSESMLVEPTFQDDYHSRADYRVAALDTSENQSAFTRESFLDPGDPPNGKHPPAEAD